MMTFYFAPNKRYEVILMKSEEDALPAIRTLLSRQGNLGQQALFKVQVQPNGEFPWPDYYAIVEQDAADGNLLAESLSKHTFSFLAQAPFRVDQPVSLPLREDKYYEFFAAWLHEGKEALLQEFFAKSQPIKETYGRPEPLFRVPLSPVENSSTADHFFHPSLGGLVEWDDYTDVEVLLSHEAFATQAAPLFAQAVRCIEMVLGEYVG